MGNQKEGSLAVKEKNFHSQTQELTGVVSIARRDSLQLDKQDSPVVKAAQSSLLKTRPQISSTNNNGSSLKNPSDSYLGTSGKKVESKKTSHRGQRKMKKRVKYGMEVILDLYDCNPKTIRSAKSIQSFAVKMCKEIKMKRYGKALTPHFGHSNPKTSGYSLLQFLETSSITGHFSEQFNSAYINIFSCKMFDSKKAISFTRKYFKAKKLISRKLIRE